jgi:hypothetical protein
VMADGLRHGVRITVLVEHVDVDDLAEAVEPGYRLTTTLPRPQSPALKAPFPLAR